MSNLEKYDSVFRKSLDLDEQADLSLLAYQGVMQWDSVGHMALIATLEDAFSISLDLDDVIDFDSYTSGKTILGKYGISI